MFHGGLLDLKYKLRQCCKTCMSRSESKAWAFFLVDMYRLYIGLVEIFEKGICRGVFYLISQIRNKISFDNVLWV